MYVLDPTAEADLEPLTPAPRLASLEHRTIGLLSNGKAATAPFFDHLESLLRNRWQPTEVLRLVKSNYSAPADVDLIRELGRCHLVVTGVGD